MNSIVPSNMSETSLQNLMKEIGEAVELDNESYDEEAYVKYSSCVYKIASNLLLDFKVPYGKFAATPCILRQVKLLQHCVERIDSLIKKMGNNEEQPEEKLTHGISTKLTAGMTSTESMIPKQSPTHQAIQHIDQRDKEDLFTKTPVIHVPVPAIPPDNPHMYNKVRMLTPTEKAYAQNRSLIIAYKARMARLNKSNFSAYNYSLTIQRKMAENLAIARSQEEQLAQKMKERQERLEEEATKRFTQPSEMSLEEREHRDIYKKILNYENDLEWLSMWRQKLSANPEDPVLICQTIQEILRCSDHPFTEMLRKFQFKIYEQVYPLVMNRQHEIDLVQVDLPEQLWPTVQEVVNILSASERRGLTPTPELRRRKEIRSRGRSSERRPDVNTDASHQKTTFEPWDTEAEEDGRKDMKDADDNDNILGSSDNSCSSSQICDSQLNAELNTEDKNSQIECGSGSETANYKVKEKEHDVDSQGVHEEQGVGETKDIKEEGLVQTEEGIDSAVRKSLEVEDINVETDRKNAATASLSGINEEISSKGECEESTQSGTSMVSIVHNTRGQVEEAYAKGKRLESELSVQLKHARLLMQQVKKDHENETFNEENFDDLFDRDSSREEDDNSFNYSYIDSSSRCVQENSPSRLCNKSEISKLIPMSKVAAIVSQDNRGEDQLHSSEKSLQTNYTVFPQPQIDKIHSSLPPMIANLSEEMEVAGEKCYLSKLSLEAHERHLKTICKDIHCVLDKLSRVMIVAYQVLDTPVGKDQCAVALEEQFFKSIWQALFILFRLVNHKKEIILACVMTKYKEATPETMKVNPKFQLSHDTSQELPYQEAIKELLRLPHYYTVPCKLDCVVNVCRLICECVDKFYLDQHEVEMDGSQKSKTKKAPVLGADDLVPVLTYVTIHSQCPQLISECHAMTEFIAEGYMMGEEGYCLTTFRTAVEFLLSLYTTS